VFAEEGYGSKTFASLGAGYDEFVKTRAIRCQGDRCSTACRHPLERHQAAPRKPIGRPGTQILAMQCSKALQRRVATDAIHRQPRETQSPPDSPTHHPFPQPDRPTWIDL